MVTVSSRKKVVVYLYFIKKNNLTVNGLYDTMIFVSVAS